MPFREIESIKKKSFHVAEQVLEAIKNGEYGAGSKLPGEREIAQLTGVSRNSVREALSALQIAGIVAGKVGVGTYVTGSAVTKVGEKGLARLIQEDVDLLDIWKAREYMESTIISLSIIRATKEDLENIRGILDEMQEAVLAKDYEKYLATNVRFHLEIAEAAHNLPLSQALMALLKVTQQISLILGDLELGYVRKHLEESFEIHEEILSVIESRNENGVTKVVQAHFKELIDYVREEFI